MKNIITIKFYNLGEIDKLFEKHNLPKLTYKKYRKLNSSVSIKEIDLIIRNLPTEKIPVSKWSHSNVTKHFRKK